MAENLAYKTNGYCIAYNNDQTNVLKFGYLYDKVSSKNVCPSGWHLPNRQEFETLLEYIGGDANIKYNALIQGGESNFSALFAGASTSQFEFWGRSEGQGVARFISSSGWSLNLYESNKGVGIGSGMVNNCGYSVRCIMDN